jgi:hypothetical protein
MFRITCQSVRQLISSQINRHPFISVLNVGVGCRCSSLDVSTSGKEASGCGAPGLKVTQTRTERAEVQKYVKLPVALFAVYLRLFLSGISEKR